jgi:H+/Cl- antiporter ClcA
MSALEHWLDLITAAIGSFIAAVAGVAMRHAHKVQRGERPPTWSRIWWDAPTVFVMGLAGGAIGEWLNHSYGMPELFGSVIAASLGYLGPSAVDRTLEWLERRGKS